MELRYPFILVIVGLILIVNIFLFKRKKSTFNTGSKIANTNYLRNTDYFKKKLRKYNLFVKIIIFGCYFCIILSAILLCRLATVKVIDKEAYNRDIFLCMDVSGSVNSLNSEVVDNLVSTVNSLKGERFGISIFNTTSVTVAPLTDDYSYIKDSLETIRKAIDSDYSINSENGLHDYFYYSSYLMSGTIEGSDVRGSSLIGDGLATCAYNFSNLDKPRTRIIIFTTDNDLAGNPIVELMDAAKICKKYNIKVFGIGTRNISKKDRQEFASAVELTGGKYYDNSVSSVSSIIKDIEKTSKSLTKENKETKRIDVPDAPFILLLVSFSILVIISKKVVK